MKYKLISFLKLLVKVLKYIIKCLGLVFFEIRFIIKVNLKGIKFVLGERGDIWEGFIEVLNCKGIRIYNFLWWGIRVYGS